MVAVLDLIFIVVAIIFPVIASIYALQYYGYTKLQDFLLFFLFFVVFILTNLTFVISGFLADGAPQIIASHGSHFFGQLIILFVFWEGLRVRQHDVRIPVIIASLYVLIYTIGQFAASSAIIPETYQFLGSEIKVWGGSENKDGWMFSLRGEGIIGTGMIGFQRLFQTIVGIIIVFVYATTEVAVKDKRLTRARYLWLTAITALLVMGVNYFIFAYGVISLSSDIFGLFDFILLLF
ncbi:MAG: hypothetical protein IH840_17535, partial [Candidatus Heimdallarchaeota archaeon]|nr:hypothetical protein [Candidatus Heimdallarchaeota archaeon]